MIAEPKIRFPRTENASSGGYQERRLGLEYPGHILEAKRGMMRQRGHGLDLLSEQKNEELDTHIAIEKFGRTWYVYGGDVGGESVEMSLVTCG